MPDLITPTTRPHAAWLQAHTEWDPDVHEDGFGLLRSGPGIRHSRRRETSRREALRSRRDPRFHIVGSVANASRLPGQTGGKGIVGVDAVVAAVLPASRAGADRQAAGRGGSVIGSGVGV